MTTILEKLWMKMNRWIKFLVKCSEIYHKQPELVEKVLDTEMPDEIFDQFYSEDELDRIRELRDANEKMLDEIENLDQKVEALSGIVSNKEAEIDELETIFLAGKNYDAPEWLDTSQDAFTPRKVVVKKSGKVTTVRMRMEDYMNYSDLMKKIVEEKNWEKLPLEEKLQKIWDFTCRNTEYAYDLGEDWRFAETEFRYGKADCEGATSLLYGLARAAGVPPTKIFFATGYFYRGDQKYGHAFIIAKPNDEWMVYEPTLSRAKNEPKKLAGSNYSVEWGLGNHAWIGKVKPSYDKSDDQKVQI